MGPAKDRWLKCRASGELLQLVDSFKARFSLPGRPASRTYLVECLLLEGAASFVRRWSADADSGAPSEETLTNVRSIENILLDIQRKREVDPGAARPDPSDDPEDEEAPERAEEPSR